MPRAAQAPLFPASVSRRAHLGFGGSKTATANPTQARPFARNAPVHIVLRSELAFGSRSLLLFDREIASILRQEAQRAQATYMEGANAGNHLHLLVRFPTPASQRNFLRAVAGLIARLALGAKKGSKRLRVVGTRCKSSVSRPKNATHTTPHTKQQKFWAGRPFTRIVDWSRGALSRVRRYIAINSQEMFYKGSSTERRARARAALKQIEELGLISFSGVPPKLPPGWVRAPDPED